MKKISELSLRQRILLVFLGQGNEKLDPIRIMKGIFIFMQEAKDQWLIKEALYQFEPYYYGPCSFQIYSDLDQLEKWAYVKSIQTLGQSWKYYLLTPKGIRLAHQLVNSMNPDAVQYLREVREFVSKVSFRQLLTAVYNNYPEYAINSVFKY